MFTKMFQKALIATTLTLPLVSLTSQSTFANDRRDFWVYNNNELEITRLYVSSAKSGKWGRNILNSDIVSGSYSTIKFNNNGSQCTYDVKAVYSDGTYDMGRTNLCETYEITFYGHGGDHR
jgi:hypothetical protein